MVNKTIDLYKSADVRVQKILHFTIYEAIIAAGCIFAATFMVIRVFYGTELTDEAFYVSDALTMMHGNVYYAYNNYSYGTGGVFLMIPFLFIYEIFVPDNAGVFLYTRICYMFFWYTIMILGYRILKKDFKKSSALLVTGFMITYAGGGGTYNFSYNTVPCALAYITGLTIYDAIEHENKFSRVKLIVSGFMMGIAVLGHLGYAVAVVSFMVVILIRTKGLKEKARNILYCTIGGIAEIFVVTVPIILQTSLSKLIAGIDNKLHPYPTETMYQGTALDKIAAVIEAYKQYIPYLIFVFVFVFFFFIRFLRENKKRLTKKGYVILAASVAMFLLTTHFCMMQIRTNSAIVNWYWGFSASIGIVFLLCMLEFRKYPVILYLGLYPIVFAFVSIMSIDSSTSTGRFTVAVPAMAIYFLILHNEEIKFTNAIVTVSVIGCILSMGINNYRYVYRDEHIAVLDHKVEYGVYKGIYTTQARAYDLPELEKYLNSIVDENEYYAFRDNVPAGYLMMHTGIMCDKATWDCMNYSYHKNAPSNLYEFYQRRGAFPQKYIYVDYGRDENLSIEDEDYKFNEFIYNYYKKTADFKLNDTFYHIIVFEYEGGFNGDFDYWIDRHMLRNN